MARETDSVRLMALGLLSYADDEGYFLADETLVRNALRPFDQSSGATLESLRRLSDMGYWEVREHPSHGKLGRIVNFLKHQKISHPTKSRIATYWSSGVSPECLRKVPEPLCPDQGIKGSRDQGSEGSADEQDIGSPSIAPNTLPSDRDHFRMQLVGEPWVKDLKRAMCKIGPENWQAWQGMVQEWGLPAVISAARGVPATERWPDQVDKTLTASRGQQNPGEVIKDRIVRISL